jgi:hypothetical protein
LKTISGNDIFNAVGKFINLKVQAGLSAPFHYAKVGRNALDSKSVYNAKEFC